MSDEVTTNVTTAHQEYSEGLSENLLEALIGCVDDLGEGAEARNQRLRQLLGVAPRQRPEQHQLEQLVIRHRVAAGVAETGAKALAMPVIMRRGLLRAGLRPVPA